MADQALQTDAAELEAQQAMQRRMQPRTQEDFNLLLDELAMWWGQEHSKVAAAQGLTGELR
jgi:hypothetical protein